MAYIAKVTAAGNSEMLVGSTLYGECTVSASTAAKTVAIPGFDTLLEGVTIHVRFQNSNSASSPTLNVSSTGAKPIYKSGSTAAGSTAATSWSAGSVVSLTYNTTNNASGCWVMNDHIDNTDTHYTANLITAASSTATANGASATDVYLNLIENSEVRNSHKISGTGGVTVSSDASGNVSISTPSVFRFLGTKATVAALPSTGNTQGDVWHVTETDGEYIWDGSAWEELGSVLSGDVSITLDKTPGTVDGVKTWSAGTAPSLTVTPTSIPNVTSVGTLPSLSYSAVSVPNVTSVGTLPSLSTTDVTIPNVTSVGTLPTLSLTNVTIPNVTSVGTLPSLTKSDVSIPNITSVGTLPGLTVTSTNVVTQATVSQGVLTISTGSVGSASGWSAGTLPTLGTAISATKVSTWSAGTLPTLGTDISATKASNWSAGTLPSLGTDISVTGVSTWSAGTLPSLGTAIGTTKVSSWSAGTLPSLGTSISVGSASGWNAGTLPSLSTETKTFLVDVTASGEIDE